MSIKKWDSYAKARYISAMLEGGRTAKEIEEEVGDRTQAVIKNAIAYKTLQQAKEELDFDISPALKQFSYMLLALGQRPVRIFLGWTQEGSNPDRTKMLPIADVPLEQPVPDRALENLRHFLSFIYGEKGRSPVIDESRDITKKLSRVLASPEATEYLLSSRNLNDAYELTDGEETMIRRSLVQANRKLETVNGIAYRHVGNIEVISEADKALATATELTKRLKG
jgi:hypothetical protein